MFAILFALMQKVSKKSSPARCSAGRAGQRRCAVFIFCNYIIYWADRL